MSIRTNPMKAVPTLLKRLVKVEKQVNVNDLKSELIKIKDVFSIVKRNEEELLDTLTVVDGYLRNSNTRKLMEKKEDICQRIRNSAQKLLPNSAIQSSDKEASHESPGKTIREDVHQVVHSPEEFKVQYNGLDRLHKRFFLSLLVFPENAVIKKSTIHFWWASTVGYFMIGQFDFVFDYLFNHELIVPHGNGKCPVVSKYKINPCVRHVSMRSLLQNDYEQLCGFYSQLETSSHRPNTSLRSLVLDKKKVKLSANFGFKSTHWRAVFNVGASYLNFGPQWLAKMRHLEVLQLGRWVQDSPTHHIEVESEEFLKELKDQQRLKYLSLRGISRIFELPASIFQLISLAILDLKACHYLETLPNDISPLRKLRHLNLSQCYLLERMPEGIDTLKDLEVLKGFVIGSSFKTPYKISNLTNLKNLERLSIYIKSEAMIQDKEFESLKELEALEHLKISWGVSDTRYSGIQIKLPSKLKKLHLQGFPKKNIPEWLKPNNLPEGLKELNLTGGKLESIDYNYSRLEIVRLKYLKYLSVDSTNLLELFPSLKYGEIKQVKNIQYFEWPDLKTQSHLTHRNELG